MKFAIVGYGRMGHEIEIIAKNRKHEVVTFDVGCDTADHCEMTKDTMDGIDVAIDFTVPESALENAKLYNDLGINAVIGTTGWYDKLQEMKANTKDIGLIWSGNFSIGVNVFFRIVENAARIIDKLDSYDVTALELHHKGKKDSPSGTAKMIGDILIENIKRKTSLVTERLDRGIEPAELHFASVRGGSIPGTHQVIFDSDADSIELTHRVRNRSGLAYGAVLAAEWIKGKKGFFNIDDLMKELVR